MSPHPWLQLVWCSWGIIYHLRSLLLEGEENVCVWSKSRAILSATPSSFPASSSTLYAPFGRASLLSLVQPFSLSFPCSRPVASFSFPELPFVPFQQQLLLLLRLVRLPLLSRLFCVQPCWIETAWETTYQMWLRVSANVELAQLLSSFKTSALNRLAFLHHFTRCLSESVLRLQVGSYLNSKKGFRPACWWRFPLGAPLVLLCQWLLGQPNAVHVALAMQSRCKMALSLDSEASSWN